MQMIFCPECDSRAIQMDKTNEKSKFKCTRTICGKEFKPRR